MHLANARSTILKTIDPQDEVGGDRLDPEAVGRALEGCRQYLLMMTERTLGNDLRVKVAASDIVQETILEGYRDFGRFRGHDGDELRAWLYCILRHNLANAADRYRGAAKRRIDREVSLDADSTVGLAAGHLPATTPTPSQHAIRREQAQALADALRRLPETDRRVLAWRHQEQLPFEEIGRRLGGSAEAARKRWARAVDRLRWIVEQDGGAVSRSEGAAE